MMRFAFKSIKRSLKKIVRKLNRVEKPKKNLFYVPKNKCILSLGGLGSFSLDDFNPYVAQVKQFQESDGVSYNNSLIKRIRANVIELIEAGKFEKKFYLNNDINLVEHLPEKFRKKKDNHSRLTCIPYRDWINAHKKETNMSNYFHSYHLNEGDFYPRKDDYQSLMYLQNILSAENFKIGENTTINSSYIQGVVLKKGWQFKIHISSGRRRAAVLAALGWSEIPVILYDNRKSMNKLTVSNRHQFLDVKNIENWMVVKNDIYPSDFARKLFNWRFEPEEHYKKEILLQDK